jgi:putative DNA primase/helicase
MLLPLATMAKETGCAVVGVRHVRKGATGDARDAGSGSGAFTAAARVEWIVGRDPGDETRHIIATTKINIALDPPSLAYRLVPANCEWETVAIRWDGTSDVTASQLTVEAASDDERSMLEEAVDFLTELLADGPVPQKIAAKEADDAGISAATLRRAKRRLGVKSDKQSAGEWVWVMKQGAHEDAHVSQREHVEPLEPLEHLPSSERDDEEDFLEGAQGTQGAHADTAMNILLAAFPEAVEFAGATC